MRSKDEAELDVMKRAAQIADEAWEQIWPTIRAGETEAAVATRLANAMDDRGGKTTFTVVAAGAMGAEPHHASDATVIQDGDVLVCDFGCLL
ncbi:M24 family metallopeptidase, partial [Acinetobacter baumannii]